MSRSTHVSPVLPAPFCGAVVLAGLLLIAGIISPDAFVQGIDALNAWVNRHFGNFYLWFVFATLILMLTIACSPLGGIRLGGPDAKPQYSFWSWFAMLFSAGMGTGFMFWGGAEPLFHFAHPPLADVHGLHDRSVLALAYTFFHWGLSPWAVYGMTSIAIGYLCFNVGKNCCFSDFLIPGHSSLQKLMAGSIDFFTLTAIVFGLAATFGMGVLLTEGGLFHVFGIAPSWEIKLIIAAIIMILFFLSAFHGVSKGIRFFSNVSMALCFVLMFFVLYFSPIPTLLSSLGESTGFYLSHLPQMSLGQGSFSEPGWVGQWTVMYWTWWIAWAPFVGVFIALISKGRTLRTIALGVLIAPTLFSCLWFTIFGKAAITLNGMAAVTTNMGINEASLVLYRLLEHLPFPTLTAALCLFMIIVSVSNSFDSAIYTLAQLSGQKENSWKLQVCWGLLFSALAVVLLLTGGIGTLRQITTVAVLPFTVLLIVLFGIVLRQMLAEPKPEKTKAPLPQPAATMVVEGE